MTIVQEDDQIVKQQEFRHDSSSSINSQVDDPSKSLNRKSLDKQFPMILEADPSKEAGGASEISESAENPLDPIVIRNKLDVKEDLGLKFPVNLVPDS